MTVPVPTDPSLDTEIVVVGAGPTGLALACGLAARGIRPVVLDRDTEGANTSRAAVLHARTLEVLDGLGVARALVDRGVVVPRFTVRDRSATLLQISFDGLPSIFPYTLMLPQSDTEAVLQQRFRELGGSIGRGRTVTELHVEAHAAVLTVAGPAGPERIRSRYVVGCDGMNSVVRNRSGIDFVGERYPQTFVLGDVVMDWPLPDDEVGLCLSPAGLIVVAPLPDGRHRVVATVATQQPTPDRPGVRMIEQLLGERGPQRRPIRVADLTWSSTFSVHHRLAESYRRGPILLAGDAAHVHSPAEGQGMNLGIRDALALAEVIAAEVLGTPGRPGLDSYEATRRPVAQDVVAATHRLTRMATLRNPIARAVRNKGLRGVNRFGAVRRQVAMQLSGLDDSSGASAGQGSGSGASR